MNLLETYDSLLQEIPAFTLGASNSILTGWPKGPPWPAPVRQGDLARAGSRSISARDVMVVQARPFRIAARQVHNAAAIPIIENVPGSGEKVTPVNPLSLPPYPVTSPLCNESSPALQIQTPSSGVFAVLLMQK